MILKFSSFRTKGKRVERRVMNSMNICDRGERGFVGVTQEDGNR